jgi:hypothetical protein
VPLTRAPLGWFEMIDWLHNNLNWIFSGIGVAVIVAVAGSVRRKLEHVPKKKSKAILSYPIDPPRDSATSQSEGERATPAEQ